jgi:hypothetical protein
MNLIKIKPVEVALNTTSNAVAFQVLTLDIAPEKFNLNARFFFVNEETKKEVSNVPFELPLEDYKEWITDEFLENKSLKHLNLERA